MSLTLPALAAGLTLVLRAAPAEAQQPIVIPPRYEITAFGGYQWGGSFDTDAFQSIPAGELALDDSFGWGVILGFLAQPGSAVELIYLRQDTDIRFKPDRESSRGLGGFANNYIQIGGRQELQTRGALHPFVAGSLGINILDPKASGVGSETRFSFSLGGGAKYMFGPTQRYGIRAEARWWTTPVPSGDYGTWCDVFGCYAVQGTSWVNQGQATGGIVFAF